MCCLKNWIVIDILNKLQIWNPATFGTKGYSYLSSTSICSIAIIFLQLSVQYRVPASKFYSYKESSPKQKLQTQAISAASLEGEACLFPEAKSAAVGVAGVGHFPFLASFLSFASWASLPSFTEASYGAEALLHLQDSSPPVDKWGFQALHSELRQ